MVGGGMTDASRLRQQASRLLELAMQAFQRGEVELGEQFTARGIQHLDEARAAEATQAPPASTESPRSVAQQQQQVPPKKDDSKE